MANDSAAFAVLLVTPPFCQPNTPYPATPFLKGALNSLNIKSHQIDLGIEVIDKLFSASGLIQLFTTIAGSGIKLSSSQKLMVGRKEWYIRTIEPVMQFLRGNTPELAYRIVLRNWLPESDRFHQTTDIQHDFGRLGLQDQAKYLATLYLEDICDLITGTIDPHFGFSRYAERLGRYANTFDEPEIWLNKPHANNLVINFMLELLEKKITEVEPAVVAITIPFPGNLFSAFKCGQWIRDNRPDIKVAIGGGFVSTELRNVTDRRVFKYIHHISLDNDLSVLTENQSGPEGKQPSEIIGITPDYDGLPLEKYFPVLEIANPMHRLWSDGRWNKLMLAQGCYWAKCSFCDVSLPYIKEYKPSIAADLCDQMEAIISQTGRNGFHFTDEAAPPSLLKSLAQEIIRRNLVVTWWTNVRFEKTFSDDLCRLLAKSGCIAVAGGLEVASPRILKLINKGVTVEQVIAVAAAFKRAGIMAHAYLMYGFPSQTEQETIDSLEVVRQMFSSGIILSGFWHRFALTAHSPVGQNPEKFGIRIRKPSSVTFALNDLDYDDPSGCDHEKFGPGLRKSLYNYMHGIGLNYPLQDWFDFRIPPTTVPKRFVRNFLTQNLISKSG